MLFRNSPVAADVRRIGAPKRGGMRPTNTQLGYGFPPGFGLRQSSAAFPPTAQPLTRCRSSILDEHLLPKRQRTAAVQNAVARLRHSSLIGPLVGRFRFHALNMEPPHVGCYVGSWKAPLSFLRRHWDHEPAWTNFCCICNKHLSIRMGRFMESRLSAGQRDIERMGPWQKWLNHS